MKSIFVSILNFNGNNDTLECLESLKKINHSNFKLTVAIIDNGSSENLNLKSQLFGQMKVEVIKNEKNLGFSGGHNVGINYALKNKADFVIILNNDTYVDRNFVEELLKTAEKDSKIGIVSPKIYFAPGFEYHKDRYSKEERGRVFWYAGGEMDWKNVIGHHRGVDRIDKGQFDETVETELGTGCCMLIRREVFDEVGTFDDRYFLYYEDADLCMRAKKNNFKIMYVPKSVIWHKNAGSAGGSGSKLQDYYITRNRLIFGMRYAPVRAKFALLRESLKLILGGRYWQKRGVADFYLGNLGKGNYKV
ncbi:MAG: glycosyltransferase family 2 protein [Candidatus Levybacteria bacterium]|nr:glycosyltransferase family 2 protein [Candidatus Levybacteria bacterium]